MNLEKLNRDHRILASYYNEQEIKYMVEDNKVEWYDGIVVSYDGASGKYDS